MEMVESESDAAARALRAVIDGASGRLAGLAGTIKTAWSFSLVRSPHRERALVATELHPQRGLLLCGGPRELPTGATTGAYAGTALYLLSDGRLLRLRYWGGWDESHARWRSRAQAISVRAAAREFPVGECVGALERALAPKER